MDQLIELEQVAERIDMGDVDEIMPLLRSRNRYIVAAALTIVSSTVCCIPHFKNKQKRLKQLNEEVVSLQQIISTEQGYIRELQTAIVRTRRQIEDAPKKR